MFQLNHLDELSADWGQTYWQPRWVQRRICLQRSLNFCLHREILRHHQDEQCSAMVCVWGWIESTAPLYFYPATFIQCTQHVLSEISCLALIVGLSLSSGNSPVKQTHPMEQILKMRWLVAKAETAFRNEVLFISWVKTKLCTTDSVSLEGVSPAVLLWPEILFCFQFTQQKQQEAWARLNSSSNGKEKKG